MKKWRRRTAFVRAQLVTQKNIDSIARQVKGIVLDGKLQVRCKDRTEVVRVGEYIVRAEGGGFYHCDPDYFERLYEAVNP